MKVLQLQIECTQIKLDYATALSARNFANTANISLISLVGNPGSINIGDTSTEGGVVNIFKSGFTQSFKNAQSSAIIDIYENSNSIWNFRTNEASDIAFSPNFTTAMTIKTGTGRVGLGTASPSATLDVRGNAGVIMTSLDNGAGTAYVCTTLASGALSTSTSACNPSSRRFKNNIENLNSGLEDLMKLRPVSFTYKPEMLIGEQNQVGFIAEEIVEIIPESVGYDKDGLPYNVDYSKLTPILTKAVQELNTKVDDLINDSSSPRSSGSGSSPNSSNTSNSSTASTTPATLDTSFIGEIVAFLNTLYDVVIERGLLRVVHLVSESITTKNLTVTESFIMYDKKTDTPYCITIERGDFVKTKGLCKEEDADTTYNSNNNSAGGPEESNTDTEEKEISDPVEDLPTDSEVREESTSNSESEPEAITKPESESSPE